VLKFTRHFGPPTETLLQEVGSLSDRLFASPTIDYAWRLNHMPDVSIFYAEYEHQLVGFKAGYAIAERKY